MTDTLHEDQHTFMIISDNPS